MDDGGITGTAEEGALGDVETMESGVVKLGVYRTYWSAVGGCLAPIVLVSLFFMQGKLSQCGFNIYGI